MINKIKINFFFKRKNFIQGNIVSIDTGRQQCNFSLTRTSKYRSPQIQDEQKLINPTLFVIFIVNYNFKIKKNRHKNAARSSLS